MPLKLQYALFRARDDPRADRPGDLGAGRRAYSLHRAVYDSLVNLTTVYIMELEDSGRTALPKDRRRWPEVGDDLSDHLYLDQEGVNRQFILLTTEPRSAPLLNAKFSTSRDILRQFMDDNARQLFALTARDAAAGELLNSV